LWPSADNSRDDVTVVTIVTTCQEPQSTSSSLATLLLRLFRFFGLCDVTRHDYGEAGTPLRHVVTAFITQGCKENEKA
jgi:hypothetical protein